MVIPPFIGAAIVLRLTMIYNIENSIANKWFKGMWRLRLSTRRYVRDCIRNELCGWVTKCLNATGVKACSSPFGSLQFHRASVMSGSLLEGVLEDALKGAQSLNQKLDALKDILATAGVSQQSGDGSHTSSHCEVIFSVLYDRFINIDLAQSTPPATDHFLLDVSWIGEDVTEYELIQGGEYRVGFGIADDQGDPLSAGDDCESLGENNDNNLLGDGGGDGKPLDEGNNEKRSDEGDNEEDSDGGDDQQDLEEGDDFHPWDENDRNSDPDVTEIPPKPGTSALPPTLATLPPAPQLYRSAYLTKVSMPKKARHPEQDTLEYIGQDIYRWHGQTCTCNSPTSPSNGYCAVAHFLGLEWSTIEKAFIHLESKSIIPFANATKHFSRRNRRGIQAFLTECTLQMILDHLQTMFHIPPNQTASWFDLSWDRPAVEPRLALPQQSIQCPSCRTWLKIVIASEDNDTVSERLRIRNLLKHCLRQRSSSPCLVPKDGSAIRTQWTQGLFSPRENETSRVPILDSQDNEVLPARMPLPLRLNTHSHTGTGDVPTYIKNLGWDDTLANLNADAKDLIRLILPPQRPNSGMHPKERHFESLLIHIDDFGAAYLIAASKFAHDLHFHVTQSITAGSG